MLIASLSLLTILISFIGGISVSAEPVVDTTSYIGCYVDKNDSSRDLRGLSGIAQIGSVGQISPVGSNQFSFDMTIGLCTDLCALGRFKYFGLQATGFCSCSFTYGSHGSAAETDCNQNCVGNASQKCGGLLRNSVYEIVYAAATGGFKAVPSTSRLLQPGPGFSVNTHWTLPAFVSLECFAACHRSPDCLACTFVQSSRVCRLMRFAAVPSEIAIEAESIWIKL